ncbi:MAG: D-alanyl-D-alanine carboxypeptidase [Croceitalea sp.]|nr:D-alanyl-D-alanine carboxypeptidase [Croceitalea sp.]
MKCNSQAILNQLFRVVFLLLIISSFLLTSCAGIKRQRTFKQVNSALAIDFYDNHFTGFMVIEPEKMDTLFEANANRYFTPASNVKIVTLFTALNLIPDHIPTLSYRAHKDSLFIQGTGDPSWMHPYFYDSTAISFLNKYETIVFDTSNFADDPFGPGWAWEDYEYAYSPELGALPLFGNVLSVHRQDSLVIRPNIFEGHVVQNNNSKNRERSSNRFYIPDELQDTLQIPFITNDTLSQKMLEQLTRKNVVIASKMDNGPKQVLFGLPTDSIYKRMMFESDNFLAEQLMLVASSTISDTLSFKIARDHILNMQLQDLTNQPRWVDGSGLSRYNLFTPESLVAILLKMYRDLPPERLFSFFPGWNQEGTISSPKPNDKAPYIFAKSGSLGNNYNLSGYLKAKSGKWLIFSFMNNHFKKSSSAVRQQMENVLKILHESY